LSLFGKTVGFAVFSVRGFFASFFDVGFGESVALGLSPGLLRGTALPWEQRYGGQFLAFWFLWTWFCRAIGSSVEVCGGKEVAGGGQRSLVFVLLGADASILFTRLSTKTS